jgi:hypothetical protein
VVVTFGGCTGNREVYCGEYDSKIDANRAAGQFRRHLHTVYDRELINNQT